jgi:FtsH-binding integral membrane protein
MLRTGTLKHNAIIMQSQKKKNLDSHSSQNLSSQGLSLSTFSWGVWVAICGSISILAGCLCGFLAQNYIQNPFLGMFSLGFFFGFVLVGMIFMFVFAAKMSNENAKKKKEKEQKKIGESHDTAL